MRATLTFCLTLAAVAPAAAQQANPRISEGLAELLYGVYCAQDPLREDPAPDTASGVINIVPTVPDFQFRQKLVPAEIGIGFGVVATAAFGEPHDQVTVIVTHPPYPETGITVESWQTDIEAVGSSLMGFSFDSQSELVLGEWTFSAVTPEGEELFFIAFEVVEPALMPQVMETCFGSFLS